MFHTNPGTWRLGVFYGSVSTRKSPKIEQNRPKLPNSSRTGPPSHTCWKHGLMDFPNVGQAPNVYRYTLFMTTHEYVFWIANFREQLSENSSERPRFAQVAAFGVASYGRGIGRLPAIFRGGAGSSSRLQHKRLAVAAALRTLPVIPNSRHSPLKMSPRVPEAPSPRGGGDIREADASTHLEGYQTTRTRSAGVDGCPFPASKPIPPRARFTIREPHSQTVSSLPALRAQCHYCGHFLCFPTSLQGSKEIIRDDVN